MSILGVSAPVHALSCIAPEEYYPMVPSQPETVVFKGVPIDQTDLADKNLQLITVSEVYQGSVSEQVEGVYRIDQTWQYMCGTGPGPLNQSAVFIATQEENQFSVSHALSGDEATQLLNVINAEATAPTPLEDQAKSETIEVGWFERLVSWCIWWMYQVIF